MENYLTTMERKSMLYRRMEVEFERLLFFYDVDLGGSNREWERFRKNWNLFIDKYPTSLLKEILHTQNIRHL